MSCTSVFEPLADCNYMHHQNTDLREDVSSSKLISGRDVKETTERPPPVEKAVAVTHMLLQRLHAVEGL